MNNVKSLPVQFTVSKEYVDNDTRFLQVEIDVLHTGLNFNNSIFDKEVVDKCVESIKNTPILGFIEYNIDNKENDFKGHEYILTRTNNGIEEKYVGSCYGVIPESCNARWIKKTSDDMQERDYLRVDGLLWTKFDDSTSIFNRDTEKAQSMELEVSSVEGFEDENGIFHFQNFRFDGCCILGKDVEPAMINSTISLNFTVKDFVQEIQNELMNFTKLQNKENNQGGNTTMANTDFSQTVLEMFSDVSNVVKNQEVIVDRWGDSVPRFYLQDIQDNEVIVVDRNDNYNYYGYSFVVNGDKVEIDFTNGNRKKIRYEDYEDNATVSNNGFSFGEHIAEIESSAFSKVDEANAKVTAIEQEKVDVETNYTQIKADYDEIKPKYDEFVKAEQDRIEAELDAQKSAEFAKYEVILADSDEFVALKDKKAELSLKEIESECAIMYARKSLAQHNFSKKTTTNTLDIIPDISDETEGFVSTKYGNIRVSNK